MNDDVPPPDWDDAAADVAALFLRTAPDPPDWAPAAVEPARTFPSPSHFYFRKSYAMKLSALALTAAGLAAAAVWVSPAEAAAVTFEDVKAAMRASPFVAFSIVDETETGPPAVRWRDAATADPPLLRAESAAGAVVVRDRAADRVRSTLAFSGAVTLGRVPRYEDENVDPVAEFRELFDRRAGKPEAVTLDGRPALKFVVEPTPDELADGRVALQIVWADPATRLPVRVRAAFRREDGPGLDLNPTYFADFEFAEEYDPALFETAVPAEIEAALPSGPFPPIAGAEPPPPATGPAPVLTAGAGAGAVRLGMSRDELAAATGVPAFPIGRGAFWFVLPGRGVTARGTDAAGVVQVYAGAVGRPGLDAAFATADGVRAGMTVEDLTAALGPPDRALGPVEDPTLRQPSATPFEIVWPVTTYIYEARRLWVVTYRDPATGLETVTQASTWSPRRRSNRCFGKWPTSPPTRRR